MMGEMKIFHAFKDHNLQEGIPELFVGFFFVGAKNCLNFYNQEVKRIMDLQHRSCLETSYDIRVLMPIY